MLLSTLLICSIAAQSKPQETIRAVQPKLPTETPLCHSPTPARSDEYLASQPKQHAKDYTQELSAGKTPSMPIDPQVKTSTTTHASNLGRAAEEFIPGKLLQRDPTLQPDAQMLVPAVLTASIPSHPLDSNKERVSRHPLDRETSLKLPVYVQMPTVPIISHASHPRQSSREVALQKPARQAASPTLAAYQVKHSGIRTKSGLRPPFIAPTRYNDLRPQIS